MIKTFLTTLMLIFAVAVQPATASNCSKHTMTLAGQASNAGIFNTLLAAAEAADTSREASSGLRVRRVARALTHTCSRKGVVARSSARPKSRRQRRAGSSAPLGN